MYQSLSQHTGSNASCKVGNRALVAIPVARIRVGLLPESAANNVHEAILLKLPSPPFLLRPRNYHYVGFSTRVAPPPHSRCSGTVQR